jgi:hypothetical protein
MPDPKPRNPKHHFAPPPPENQSPPNQAALEWLKQEPSAKKDYLDPSTLPVLSLAMWGLDNGAEGDWPERDRPAVEMQVGHLCGWTPADVMGWLRENPEGDDPEVQEADLTGLINTSSSAKQAAARVLTEIYYHQRHENPALQPAASELS